MPKPIVFPRPSLSELIDARRQDYASRFPGGDALKPQGVLPAFSRIDAEIQNGLHEHLDQVAYCQHPMFARGDWLDAWAIPFRQPRKPSSVASGLVRFNGKDGAVLPKGAVLRRDDGARYAAKSSVAVTDGSAVVSVEAEEAGASFNTASERRFTLLSPVIGIDSVGLSIAPGITGGTETETDESLRARVLFALREPPQGGSEADWLRWTLEVPGVTRAWVSPQAMGIGTMTVRFVMDEVYADRHGIPIGDGAPEYSGDLKTVYDYVDTRRPAGMRAFFVVAPDATPIDIRISGLTPDTEDVREAVQLEIADMLIRRSEPGVTIHRSWVVEAIGAATGEAWHGRVRLARAGKTPEDVDCVDFGVNDLLVLGDIVYA